MSAPTNEPFNREEILDEPGIIGARWWQRSLAATPDPVTRRSALTTLLVASGAVVAIGMVGAVLAAGSDDDEYRTEQRGALEMQKQYGWSFGAANEHLTFDGASYKPFDRGALARMPSDMRPSSRALAAYYVPTLFQSPSALPRSAPPGDTTAVTPLKNALRPIYTQAMARAYRSGRALASLWKTETPTAAVIVDLPGPEAVAFAAGAAGTLDPVFLFDNWPHPRGVVKAHMTLAATVYYQPLFARKQAPSGAMPMFVLDHGRLAPYSDDATQFDNRHIARVPTAAQLRSLGVTRVLYVTTTRSVTRELDDLNDEMVLYAKAGLDVKMMGADAFAPDPTEAQPPRDEDPDASPPPHYYGGRSASHAYFWVDYPWSHRRPSSSSVAPPFSRPGKDYAPHARSTPFSTGTPSSSRVRTHPAGFGKVPVVIAIATGTLLGARLSRSGSWNRSGGYGRGG